MQKRWNQEQRQSITYTCMLWGAGKDDPVVVTVHEEHEDRWIGRRVVGALTSLESPSETFLKSEWRRDERASNAEQPEQVPSPAVLDARSRYLKAFKGLTP